MYVCVVVCLSAILSTTILQHNLSLYHHHLSIYISLLCVCVWWLVDECLIWPVWYTKSVIALPPTTTTCITRKISSSINSFLQQHAIVFMKYYSSSNKCTQYRSMSLNNEQYLYRLQLHATKDPHHVVQFIIYILYIYICND